MFTRRALRPLLFASLAFALGLPACLSLQKVALGNRVIADFEEIGDGGADGPIEPTWNLFTAWTCSASVTNEQNNADAGGDGGPDGGGGASQPTSPDGGQPVSCSLGPGDPDLHGLVATFDVAAAGKGQQLAVEVTTKTSTGTVDFTAFQQFLFDAELEPTVDAFPMGTELKIELGCSKNTGEAFVDYYLQQLAPRWNPFTVPLIQFQGTHSFSDQACLAHVDSIRFAVLFGSPTGTSMTPIAGTLGLDNIELE